MSSRFRRCSRPMWLAASLSLVTAWALAEVASGQVLPRATVQALWRGEEPVRATLPGEVCLVRDRDLAELGVLAVGDPLAPGDTLAEGPCPTVSGGVASPAHDGPAVGVLVGLRCGEGTELRLSGRFRLLIREPEAEDCAVELLNGTLDVLTDRPAEVTSGGVTIGVEGTEFTVVRDDGTGASGQQVVCRLFDGRLRVEAAQEVALGTGETLTVAGGEVRRDPIDPAEIAATAARHARLDIAGVWARSELAVGSAFCAPAAAAAELAKLYAATLTRPDDVDGRAALARALLEHGLVERARFELRRAGLLENDEALRRFGIERGQLAPPASSPPLAVPLPIRPTSSRLLSLSAAPGTVLVRVPIDVRPGERISGSMKVSGAGPEEEVASQLKSLGRFQVALGSATIPVKDGPWSVLLPTSGAQLEISLRDRKGTSKARRSIDLTAPSGPLDAGAAVTAPPLCRAGNSVTIAAPFDGDYRTTQITFAGAPVRVLAESPREVVIECPGGSPGRSPLAIAEGGQRLGPKAFRAIGVETSSDPAPIPPGTKAKFTIRLRGLQGLAEPLGLQINNVAPVIARIESGDEQFVELLPTAWGCGDSATYTLDLFGLEVGETNIAVTLVPFTTPRSVP